MIIYQDSRPLAPSTPKVNSKFEILLVKVFNLKQKANQIHPATIENINLCLFKNTASFLETIKFVEISNWRQVKQKQFRHI